MASTVVSPLHPPHDLGGSEALTELRRAIETHRGPPVGELLAEQGLGAYRGYAEVLEQLGRAVAAGARLTTIGRSVCGECLFALEVGREDATPATRTTAVLSGLHPMEWIGVEVNLALVERLVASPPTERAVVCLVLANPDGWLRTEQNLREGRRRLVRHNARGVDLGCNFDARWGRRGTASRCIPWLFRPGRHAASEPEVSAIAHSLGGRRIDRAVGLHAIGSCVRYPSGHGLLPIADAAEHAAWARAVSAALGTHPNRSCRRSGLVPGFGTGGRELEWFHQRHGALSLRVQCPGGGVPKELGRLVHPFAWFNPNQPAEVAARVANAILHFVRGDAKPPEP